MKSLDVPETREEKDKIELCGKSKVRREVVQTGGVSEVKSVPW